MRRTTPLFLSLLLFACGPNKEQTLEIQKLNDSLRVSKEKIADLEKNVVSLRDSVNVLKYPADQRFSEINRLVANNELKKAKHEIAVLKKIFPKSNEASLCADVLAKIEELEQKAIEEEKRIKALGFKAIPQQTSFRIDYNKITLSDIKIGKRYIHDNYGYEYRYHEADRGSKYVLVTMTVTSENKDPKLPDLQIYTIDGGEMKKETFFYTNFARWDDYGSYLGNDHDFGNDFSKTSTIKFKLAAEVSDEVLAGKFAIVCKNVNCLSRSEDRFANPPISYNGSANYEFTLTPESFKEDYILVKTFNF